MIKDEKDYKEMQKSDENNFGSIFRETQNLYGGHQSLVLYDYDSLAWVNIERSWEISLEKFHCHCLNCG